MQVNPCNKDTSPIWTLTPVPLVRVSPPPPPPPHLSLLSSYLVMELMSSDLYKTLKSQKLTNDQVRFQMYQVLRGLKVHQAPTP